jgi:transcriptional antiterminator RfaH
VQTQVNSEEKARANLEQQGYNCFLPRYKKTISHARKKQLVLRPLFPRYLFVSLDLTVDRWRAIRSTVGVSTMIMNGDVPSHVTKGLIEGLIERCDEQGLIVLATPASFAKGERVKIISGAFEETFGLVEGVSDKDRVTILINLLGRETRVSLKAQELESSKAR